jgi:protease I
MLFQRLSGIRVAILVADGFEQVELAVPLRHLIRNGAEVEVVSLRRGRIRGVHGLMKGSGVRADRTVFTARARNYDALLIPGGLVSPDLLRQSRRTRDFVRAFDVAGKPIAFLCHAPWVLISAGLVHGRRLTSWPGIKDDVRNAGGRWIDKSVVHDGNWITSRGPHDLLQFNRAMVRHFSGRTAGEHRYPVPPGALLLGGVSVLALGLGIRRLRRDDREERGEYPPSGIGAGSTGSSARASEVEATR